MSTVPDTLMPPGESRRWRVLVLTCRDPATDFRLPLAQELHALGHDVVYAYLKRRPAVTEMAAPGVTRTFSLPGFLLHIRRRLAGGNEPLLVLNSTNLVFPGLSRLLRLILGGVWCFDMHDDLLYDKQGAERDKALSAQRRLLAGADFLVHAAPTLKELFPSSHHLGNASTMQRIERPDPRFDRLLVLASIDHRMDFDMVSGVAEANPDLRLDIYGQVSRNDPAVASRIDDLLRRHPNVAYRGAYVNGDLPAILGDYAVTLAPYVVDSRLTRYLDPLRYYHCLNSGMEVLSTDIPKARDFGEVLHIVREPQAVGPLLARLRDDASARRNIDSTSLLHNWRNRAIRLTEIAALQLDRLRSRNA